MRRSCQEVYHRQTLMYYYQQRDGVSSPPWMTSGCHFDSDTKMYLQQRSRSPQHNGAQDHIHQRKTNATLRGIANVKNAFMIGVNV